MSAQIVRGDDLLDSDTIKATLRQNLPFYMVPTHISFVEEIKTTKNGKKER